MTNSTQNNQLGDAAMEYLLDRGSKVSFAQGETIVRRGEPGQNFFVVLAGEVEIHLEGSGGRTLALARLAAGATFGEMALLRNEPVSADVVAVSPTTVLQCPAEEFKIALAECEPLRTNLLARLAGDLQRTTSEAWTFFLKADALQLLIDSDGPPEPLVARSPKMRVVVKHLGDLAATEGPVLIQGEPGTGKVLAAHTLHDLAYTADAPMIIVDCRRLVASDPARLLLGPPGRGDGDSRETGPGALHLARGGSLILRHVGELTAELQGRLVAVALESRTRLIATEGLEARAVGSDLHDDLLDATTESTLIMPAMGERRRDIVPLARLFLKAADPSGELHFTEDAERALASLDFGRRNGAQLREAVEVAALCADGSEIRPEHIFGGAPAEEKPPGIDLARIAGVGNILEGRAIGLLRLLVLLSFTAVIVVCLGVGSAAVGSAANAFIWSVWEPVIFALFLLAGSLWCTVCPLSTAGRWAQRLGTLGRPPPGWLKRHGVWLATLGFLVIVWTERVFHMATQPAASAVLLMSLVVASVACCAVFSREVWCRYICPLGALASGLAPAAPLELGARPGLCTSSCSTHNCFKGALPIPGCTVFHHPLNVGESHQCKLCFDCLKSCPHGSTGLFLRLPLTGVGRLNGASSALAPFAIALFALAPVFLVARRSPALDQPATLLIVGLGAILAGGLLWRWLPRILVAGHGRQAANADAGAAVRIAFGLLVLAWGPLMAYQIANIEALGELTVNAAAGSLWGRVLPGAGLNLMWVSQVAAIGLAAVAAVIVLVGVFLAARRQFVEQSAFAWAGMAAVVGMYVAGVLLAIG